MTEWIALTTTCKHGQLARSCELCEKDAENERLREELATARGLLVEGRYVELYEENKRLEAKLDRLKSVTGSGCTDENCRYYGQPHTHKAQQAQEPVAYEYHGRFSFAHIHKDERLLFAAPQSAEVDQLRAALEKARDAFGEIAWSNNTIWQSDRAKAELAAIDAVMKGQG